MDLGTDLRTARERAGFSLPELAARTKIPMKSLRAIEENDFNKVPPGIFLRSFIRTYAHEVGVDPTVAIAEYRAMTEPVDGAADEPQGEAAGNEEIRPRSSAPDLSQSGPGWGYAFIAAALLIGLIGVNRYSARDQTEALTANATVGTEASTKSTAPVATTGGGVQMEMRAQGPCWVKATVDGQFAFARLMQPGETETLTGQQDITVRVGDPSALSYSINGRPGQPLGAANIPATVRFTPDGRHSRVS
jgi:cytoskeletal protein RodZ